MPKTVIESLSELRGRVGQEIAVSEWLTVTQERITAFAAATGDHQWIHLDPERARRESPFGCTIAHGFLTLSLLAHFFDETVELRGVAMGINYGMNRVRFPAPVRVGSRIRGRFLLKQAEDIGGGLQLTWQATVEIEGADKPACVAELLNRRHG